MEPRDLYGLPLERFVPERTALVKALRAEKRTSEAAEVAKLPKPSRAAWAVNQVVRTQKRTVLELFDAGDSLQQAQADVIGGRGDAKQLRVAADRERAAVKQLTEAARGLLSADGHALTAATLDRVSETLHAAALDEGARHQVERACLERELRHVGLGEAGAPTTSPTPSRSRRSPRAKHDDEVAERAAAKQAARERAEQLTAARQAEAEARRTAGRAARAQQVAEERRDRAADALAEADDAVAQARERAGQAARAHQLAEQTLKRLQD
jgi:hypothetical protein